MGAVDEPQNNTCPELRDEVVQKYKTELVEDGVV